MFRYGQLIDADYDPSKNESYNALSDYFNDPSLKKLKDSNGYSMYICKIYSLLGKEQRYLIVFVVKDSTPVGHSANLSDLRWESLQTRTLEEHYDLLPHSYRAVNKPPLNDQIEVISRDENKSVYNSVKLPLVITLLHSKKNSLYQYSPKGTVVTALETFQTIITFR